MYKLVKQFMHVSCLGIRTSNIYMYMYTCMCVFLQLLAELMVRLAKHNIGYIDWSPYMAQVHTQTCILPIIVSMHSLYPFVTLFPLNLIYHTWNRNGTVCSLSIVTLQIFNRVLKSFQLPVGPKEYHAENVKKKVFLSPQKAASFIVSMMVSDKSISAKYHTRNYSSMYGHISLHILHVYYCLLILCHQHNFYYIWLYVWNSL